MLPFPHCLSSATSSLSSRDVGSDCSTIVAFFQLSPNPMVNWVVFLEQGLNWKTNTLLHALPSIQRAEYPRCAHLRAPARDSCALRTSHLPRYAEIPRVVPRSPSVGCGDPRAMLTTTAPLCVKRPHPMQEKHALPGGRPRPLPRAVDRPPLVWPCWPHPPRRPDAFSRGVLVLDPFMDQAVIRPASSLTTSLMSLPLLPLNPLDVCG